MIESFHLCRKHSYRLQGVERLDFAPGINALVGPNGSGKSTVLRAMNQCPDCRVETRGAGVRHYFDSERMNPHAPADPPGSLPNMVLRARGMFSSHGQIMRAALAMLPVQGGDTVLIDEPEAGQDLAGVELLRDNFRVLRERGCQVVIATHHPLFLHDVRILELVPGYVEQIRRGFQRAVEEMGSPD